MKVEILHIEECPNWQQTGPLVEEALAATGHTAIALTYKLLSTTREAEAQDFPGSPTITIDGDDLFPSSGYPGGLACRVYPTPNGLAGMPTVEQVIAALEKRQG